MSHVHIWRLVEYDGPNARWECGTFHAPTARFCERCGAQPPRLKGTGRQEPATMTQAETSHFVASCVMLGEALKSTGGKWGVA